MSTTSNSNSDIDTGKLIETNDEKRLVDFEPKNLGLDEG
jgi:hypothetical protein